MPSHRTTNSFKGIPINVSASTGALAADEMIISGRHNKIHPRKTSGVFTRWRWFFVWATQLFFFGVPWLNVDGHQALLFDLGPQRFYVGSLIFLPQDFIYLTALLVLCALGLFAWTAVGGRLWCGFSCPQTVYTEIFVWIEQLFEGDRAARIKLDNAPLSTRKVAIKTAKHAAWVTFSLWTGLTFVGYFTPMRALTSDMWTLTASGYALFWTLFYAFATYGNAGWLREQVCKYMCPYARFQSAMFDADTLVVSYDAARGEPRGGRSKHADAKAAGLGACVDCTLCVQVCPAGIDIRNGLQYECIGCALCVDACNSVMDKVGYPRGLIRFSTENLLAGKVKPAEAWSRLLRPRVLIYAALIAATVVISAVALWQRTPVKLNIARERVALVREAEDGMLENSYVLQIENADVRAHDFKINANGLDGIKVLVDQRGPLHIASGGSAEVNVRLHVDAEHAGPGSHEVEFRVAAQDQPQVAVTEPSRFYGR